MQLYTNLLWSLWFVLQALETEEKNQNQNPIYRIFYNYQCYNAMTFYYVIVLC